jgi:hypothetical protein
VSYELIQHINTPTSGAWDFTGLSLGSYRRLHLHLDGLIAGADGVRGTLEYGIGGSLHTALYRYGTRGESSSGANNDGEDSSDPSARIIGVDTTTTWGQGNAAGECGMMHLIIRNPGAGRNKLHHGYGCWNSPSGALVNSYQGGSLDQTGAIDRIRIAASTGWAGGSATLYGVKSSADTDPVWVVLQHMAAPVGGIFDFSSLDFSPYRRVIVLMDGIQVSDNAVSTFAQLYTNSVLRTTGYRWRHNAYGDDGGTSQPAQNTPASGTSIPIIHGGTSSYLTGNDAWKSFASRLELSCLASGSIWKLATVEGTAITSAAGDMVMHGGGASLEQTDAITGLKIFPSAGTFTVGRVTVYGLAIA